MIRYDMIRYDMIHDMIWYDMTRYDMIRYDKIRYDMIWYDKIWYDIFVTLQLGSHPVAVVQYTVTHKITQKYTKPTIHRRTQNKQDIEQHKNLWKSADRAWSLRVISWHLSYNWRKSTEKPVRVAEECQLARWRCIHVQWEHTDITIKIHKLQY
jgi:hypothetical protein